ncbi:MAG: FecR domain-containing protein [Methylacidiphilales bacterium]|nr:FecR domain-containing protein [Candidatus Methylacidiphilales bacterium]
MSLSSLAMADDHFAVAVDGHGSLVIYGPKGEKVAILPAPSVSQPVTIGSTSFQVSYGRDANDLLTAIIAPNTASPQDLHFNVLSKSVDADKQAVVTLVFSPSLNHVSVDPGYIGTVSVNSQTIRHHEVADNTSYAPSPIPAPMPRTTVAMATRAPADSPSTPATTEDYIPSSSYEPSASATDTDTTGDTPASGAPLMKPPLIGSLPNQSPPPYALNSSPVGGSGSGSPPPNKLFWSEPVTPLKGPPPTVPLNEMKLVQVQGPVSVQLPNGDTRDGQEGMIVPSGSTVTTADGASAAVFMGGVNSARLLPNCQLKVSQSLHDSVRRTTIDLTHGAVFSRIGHRPGETQDYEVHTPEGVAAARGTEMLTYRGDPSSIDSPTTMNGKVSSDRLIAWSPVSLEHGVLSDVANPLLHAAAFGHNSLYVYVAKGSVQVSINGATYTVVSGGGGTIGSTVVPAAPDAHTAEVLNRILEILQPFNTELTQILADINNGTATPEELTLYNELEITGNTLHGFIGDLTNQSNTFEDYPNLFNGDGIPNARRGEDQDLFPFHRHPLTPGPFIPSD